MCANKGQKHVSYSFVYLIRLKIQPSDYQNPTLHPGAKPKRRSNLSTYLNQRIREEQWKIIQRFC